ncbi:hypothetical protein V5799_019384, partial [Amblyomma americanum]
FNHVTVDGNAMFDEINNVSHYVTAEKIKEWKAQKISVGERWVEILGHFEKNDAPCENLMTVL